MSVLRFYPTKDSTIYENAPERNAGIDQILEITKAFATSSTGGEATASYNSRILMDFDWSAISSSLSQYGYSPDSCSYSLKLYATEASEISLDYTIEVYPVSSSWSMGIGKVGTIPATTQGVSWYYRVGASDLTSAWQTSSFTSTYTASWQVNPGGGVWDSAYPATQSFDYTTTDLNVDVSNIIAGYYDGTVPTLDGLIVKKSQTDEQSLNSIKALRFYSKETHTIYSPILEAKFDDSVSAGTVELIDTDDEYNVVAVNLRPSYKEGSRPLLRFSPRYRFPVQTYQTSSLFLDLYRLPSNTQYAIYYAHSDDVVIGFDQFTTLSDDAKGSYCKLHLDSFQPERLYRILLKIPQQDGVSYDIYDRNWIFKVERN